MPLKFDWYISEQVIYVKIWGDQTFEELQEANLNITRYLDSVTNRPVHIIINDEDLKSIPVGLVKVLNALSYMRHKQLGWIVMVNDKDKPFTDKVQHFIAKILAKAANTKYKRLKTLSDALKYLRDVDKTLDWDTTNSELSV